MKKTMISLMLLGSIATTLTISCSRDEDNKSLLATASNSENSLVLSNSEVLCSYISKPYVDWSWSYSAILKSELETPEDTEFMKNELKKNAALWKLNPPKLGFVYDPEKPSSTYNATSYTTGKIYYGYAIYEDAKSKSPDNIVNAMILAHEYGHQLQFKYNLPSVKESTYRSSELEADGFAGYYLRKPEGFNKKEFSEIAAAYNFAAEIGDYAEKDRNHHGTPPQRKTAVRLGFLLGEFSLSVNEFDSQFYYYYSSVLEGDDPSVQPRSSRFRVNPEIDQKIQAHMGELKKIASGEMADSEFRNLD
ncbi:metalloprotease [Elizabethkingia argentiflava]|uniref:Metalloprotease n=1 Tax=Elizabethkingia argenteiflava TaxID=2681556 RepID=A0A845PZ46_9FLAO|nr:metalloprotease [Elizabethkingia argenteiflava]NAW52181.1 metalloprotease [Elizabethkingia argenteiflava]